jgi:hypothetical protein
LLARLKLGLPARSMPEMQNLNSFPRFVNTVIDVERRMQQPP